jgi:hypothetical protein
MCGLHHSPPNTRTPREHALKRFPINLMHK